eukprot:TRINITY_DN5460_c0_g1_i4.p1 TRINITY_DN5460_c0_g1~~TRINITY_DN5460_c0_g1_i4.p1  ORF type:complete len:593 (+),score=122.13 TRINITY_DN5460_c0_g1_i4:65-1843(+)
MQRRDSHAPSDGVSHEDTSTISFDDSVSANGTKAKKKTKLTLWKRKKSTSEGPSKSAISEISDRTDHSVSDLLSVDTLSNPEIHASPQHEQIHSISKLRSHSNGPEHLSPSLKAHESRRDSTKAPDGPSNIASMSSLDSVSETRSNVGEADGDTERRQKRNSFWKKKKPQKEELDKSQIEESDMQIHPDDDPETVKKKKRFWRRSGSRKPLEIGVPYNVIHKSHVDFDFQWTMQNPKETFEMLELLGTGTFGTVHRARHRENGFVLAIKSIKIKGEEGLEEVRSEINILKKLKHPNIVSYYGCCTINQGELWIMMEYCNVGSVRDFMDMWPEPFTEDQIATILSHTLAGVAYLHENKIAHRDIKSANILLDSQGKSKIGDFGVAGQLTRSLGKLHDFVGTVLFMAPEMLKDRATYDLSADIWALGITSLELAEQGYVPYCTERIMTAIRKITTNPPPTFSEPTKWSPQFRDFLNCCLQKDPKKRPKAKMLLMHPFILSHRTEFIHNTLSQNSNHSTPGSTPPQIEGLSGAPSPASIQPFPLTASDSINSISANSSFNHSVATPMSTSDSTRQPLLPKSPPPPTSSGCCCLLL